MVRREVDFWNRSELGHLGCSYGFEDYRVANSVRLCKALIPGHAQAEVASTLNGPFERLALHGRP